GTLAPLAVEGSDATAVPPAATTVADLQALGVTITDGCPTLTVTSSDGAPTGTCPITIVRTYPGTDPWGNASTITQNITIDDTQAPQITGTLAPLAVEGCDATAVPPAATTVADLQALGVTITDGCSPLNVTSSDGAPTGTCPITIVRTYTVTDPCGNSATITQNITVDDTQAPQITGTL